MPKNIYQTKQYFCFRKQLLELQNFSCPYIRKNRHEKLGAAALIFEIFEAKYNLHKYHNASLYTHILNSIVLFRFTHCNCLELLLYFDRVQKNKVEVMRA